MSTEMLQLAQLLTNHRLEVNKLESEIESLREQRKTAKADGIREAIKVAQSCLMHSEAYKNKNHLNIGDFIVELINYANKLRGK